MKSAFHWINRTAAVLALFGSAVGVRGQGADNRVASLPGGVTASWSTEKAFKQSSATREEICLNGLWNWQPAEARPQDVPSSNWGWFKAPGCWPGITDYMQKDSQTVFPHSSWKSVRLGQIPAAWYQRQFTVPANWTHRSILIRTESLNSLALVYVDGKRVGEIRFPGGELDVTKSVTPGATHTLSMQVISLPLNSVMMSHNDTFGTAEVQGRVERRGLCGDTFLISRPSGESLEEVRVSTSVRNWSIEFSALAKSISPNQSYSLRAVVIEHGRTVATFKSKPFTTDSLTNGSFSFSSHWKPGKLWDTHTPTNQYEFQLSLLDQTGAVKDVAIPQSFGFREFWINGRDFYLNGSRIFLASVPLDNAQIGAAWARYDAARESMRRLKSFGINFVYTHNYGCEPGTHLSYSEILRAADDEGMLISFSQPHFSQYQWKSPDADTTNGYRLHAKAYVQAAGNHPSVIFYSMSHNSTGTEESMNPEMIDGFHDVRNQWSSNNVTKALRSEAIVHELDPTRIVYHHSSGNLSSMHTANFYANFAPVQEMSDWLGHWATTGVKPIFLCEYGVPIFWDWMMYRGWYKGVRTFGSAEVPWELCIAEWDSQFLGAKAYNLTDIEKECIRWEAGKFQAEQTWHRWDYPRNAVESPDLDQRNEVMALYLTDNLRAFRTWGISAFCPWDHGTLWKLRPGVTRGRRELKVDWEHLQRPGFSPDYVDSQMEWMNTSFESSDWIPTIAGEALIRNNQPLLAYIGGKASAFTSKEHNFLPGERVEKQLILINNSRQTARAECRWGFGLNPKRFRLTRVELETGNQLRIPLSFKLPLGTPAGRYSIRTTVTFNGGMVQTDEFAIDVLPASTPVVPESRIAIFDPAGETTKWLASLGIRCIAITPGNDLAGFDLLVIGKKALTLNGEAPDLSKVRQGLRVICFEQTAEVLEKRLGFRIAEYGLRNVFDRVPDHPLLRGISVNNLRDWRGEATLSKPQLDYQIGPRHAPEVKWCDIPVTRLWRAGNRGNLASVLIEKPARGDFMPILDGGFSLQYSPLMEYREKEGMILFCQLDVTGRTETDPAAAQLTRNMVQYASTWKASPRKEVLFLGGDLMRNQLNRAGFSSATLSAGNISTNALVVIGPGAGMELRKSADALKELLKANGKLLMLGLDADEANVVTMPKIKTRSVEHISAFFESFSMGSPFAGISPADVHNRVPRKVPLITDGAQTFGNGVLALATNANIVFCQMSLNGISEADGGTEKQNVRKTYRKTSYLMTRLLANMGGASTTPLLGRIHTPVPSTNPDRRWLTGFYLDTPVEWDDPYRFFCW